MNKKKEKFENLTKKQKIILTSIVGAIWLLIILSALFNKGVENGTIDVSILPLLFTLLFFFIIPFGVVVALTVVFAKMYIKKKNVLTLYEKTFGLINDDELDYDLSIYQSYLEEDIWNN